jgi:tetratricopeptide (TPR) repeat protein
VGGKGRIGALSLVVVMMAGCSLARTEFYRGETRHLYARGCEAYGGGDLEQAGALLQRLVELDPAHGRGHALLGHLALARGDGAEADACYRRALDREPALTGDLIPWMVQAAALQEERRLRKAGADLKGLLELLEAGDDARLQALLETCPALDDLARDAFSLTPIERKRMRRHVVHRLLTIPLTPSERLFAGLFLSAAGTADPLAARALETWLAENGQDERRGLAETGLRALQGRAEGARAGMDGPSGAGGEGMTPKSNSSGRDAPARDESPDATAPSPNWFRLVTSEPGGRLP